MYGNSDFHILELRFRKTVALDILHYFAVPSEHRLIFPHSWSAQWQRPPWDAETGFELARARLTVSYAASSWATSHPEKSTPHDSCNMKLPGQPYWRSQAALSLNWGAGGPGQARGADAALPSGLGQHSCHTRQGQWYNILAKEIFCLQAKLLQHAKN